MKTILQTIGNTPLVHLDGFVDNLHVNIFAKLEGQNPGGSIKDRVALFMIEQAERKGELTNNKIILEATSGNMGIALAMVGAIKGYKVQIVMSAGMSEERKKMMRAFGAELILTDTNLGTEGAIIYAQKLLKNNAKKYWFADQFNNKNNAYAHYKWTAPEILSQLPNIDVLIAGSGTGGTIMGLTKYFKKHSPQTKIIMVKPPAGYKIQGLQNPKHDFIGQIFDTNTLDTQVEVKVKQAYQTARETASKYGLFAGMSSGAALFTAKQTALKLSTGNIVVIIPDRGEKYLSTPLYQ